MIVSRPAASSPIDPRRGSPGRARSGLSIAPGAATSSALTVLPLGQRVALLILHANAHDALMGLIRELVPGHPTPSVADYADLVAAGLAAMPGGIHLTPAGACAAAALMRGATRQR